MLNTLPGGSLCSAPVRSVLGGVKSPKKLKHPRRVKRYYRHGLCGYRYINGNYLVVGNNKGIRKKALRAGEELKCDFPDSVDLKITNKCSWGCSFCHESSTSEGKSFNLKRTKRILSELPKLPIEIAIGGGNILDCPEEALKLVKWLMHRDNQPRITINCKDVLNVHNFTDAQKKLISAVDVIGISLDKYREDVIFGRRRDTETYDKIKYSSAFRPSSDYKLSPFEDAYSDYFEYKNKVFHIIAGIFPIEDLKKLLEKSDTSKTVLILGYKQWGRAKNTKIPDMTEYKKVISEFIKREESKCVLSFDNLAIEQLDIKSMVDEETWKKYYLGGEGEHSMYIDAVNEEFSITSRSPERVKWRNKGLIDYFNDIKNGKNSN